MWYNNANCDIFIGKGAGKKLMEDIRNAKSSVKIVSPYLSPYLVQELIDLHDRGIGVQLITSDNIEDFNGVHKKNIFELIDQIRKVNKDAEIQRDKWRDLTKILFYIFYGFIAFLIGAAYYVRDEKIAFGLIPIVIVLLIIRMYKSKIKNIQIYNYTYRKLFPFKVYISPYKSELSDTFIHGKVYLIDDHIVYLGSLNFTGSGTKQNYETRIRTTDKEAVNEISKEINQLYYESNLPEKDIQKWGKQLYSEPIN